MCLGNASKQSAIWFAARHAGKSGSSSGLTHKEYFYIIIPKLLVQFSEPLIKQINVIQLGDGGHSEPYSSKLTPNFLKILNSIYSEPPACLR